MAVKVFILQITKLDIGEVFEWYERRQAGLGEDFLREVDKALGLLKRNPEVFPQKYKSLRVVLINRFPYGLFYKIENDENLRIHACLHLRRNINNILKHR